MNLCWSHFIHTPAAIIPLFFIFFCSFLSSALCSPARDGVAFGCLIKSSSSNGNKNSSFSNVIPLPEEQICKFEAAWGRSQRRTEGEGWGTNNKQWGCWWWWCGAYDTIYCTFPLPLNPIIPRINSKFTIWDVMEMKMKRPLVLELERILPELSVDRQHLSVLLSHLDRTDRIFQQSLTIFSKELMEILEIYRKLQPTKNKIFKINCLMQHEKLPVQPTE